MDSKSVRTQVLKPHSVGKKSIAYARFLRGGGAPYKKRNVAALRHHMERVR